MACDLRSSVTDCSANRAAMHSSSRVPDKRIAMGGLENGGGIDGGGGRFFLPPPPGGDLVDFLGFGGDAFPGVSGADELYAVFLEGTQLAGRHCCDLRDGGGQ